MKKLIVAGIFLLFFLVPFIPAIQADNKTQADTIIIEKKARLLTIFSKGKAIKTYKIALGRSPVGPKTREGDNKTPEGIYFIDSKNINSSFHRSLHVSYPNSSDLQNAKKYGITPGGNIMIHGMRNGLGWIGRFHRIIDWTKGCVAVTDKEIDEIWDMVPIGTAVEIRP